MSTDLKSRLKADLITARKGRDKLRTLVISTMLSDVRNMEIDQRVDVDDDGVIQILSRGIKQRKDASEQMRAAGRDELADVEDEQAAVLKGYLPEGLSEDDVRAIVRQAIADGADQMGPLMGRVMPQIKGRFDGNDANRIVREELAAG
ncbi:MAG: GatB/YqeY domain-containing protein [Gemmatimonadales bacterium]|nr:GatB/YqeY domain-containing protein [Gemmatimonadales bacterium]MDG2240174.1 GatB/YqeY domain-containing protein [Longimicrobiales bacterium]NCG34106.1 GatB/YqeY domain-containing protein [Pseudomonadota bacterium]MBT3773886.1 GatB/YqeY domain-containing protein [Gemmatimonadales bacterium]MBT3958237.1 GatB/YqeY domain-containing protein [Gemmatimonadales bacterium]